MYVTFVIFFPHGAPWSMMPAVIAGGGYALSLMSQAINWLFPR
jgi:hypothetical protein